MRFEYVNHICTKMVLTEFHRLISIRRDRKQEFLLHWAASPPRERAFLLFFVMQNGFNVFDAEEMERCRLVLLVCTFQGYLEAIL